MGLSLFATNMSGSSFIGLAGAGYNQGIAVYSYEWMAVVVLIFFVFFILPFYLRSGVFTMPEFLEKRYDRRSRMAFSAFNVFANVFVDCAAALYAGALVIRTLFPAVPLWDFGGGASAHRRYLHDLRRALDGGSSATPSRPRCS